MGEQPTTGRTDAEAVAPERASSELAGQTPPHADAEEMERALRTAGPLVADDQEAVRNRRHAATEEGPGTSLT